jgi:pyruvyltransferase
MVRKIYKKLYLYTRNFFIELVKKNHIIVNGYFEPIHHSSKASRRLRNWGDAVNYYLIKELSNKNIVDYRHSILSKIKKENNFMFVGSIITQLSNPKSIIWGSGVISDSIELKIKPEKVLAVRGPLTRNYLLKNNISCPEVYGDPVLLLPKIYNPPKSTKYDVGIIPHHIDEEDINLLRITNNANLKIKIISLVTYSNWKSVVDDISECNFIVSSSLHGLILADSYNIPNSWVSFSDKIMGNNFKYYDYYASVHKEATPFYVTDKTTIDDILNLKCKWIPASIDLNPLIEACPFKILLNK